MSTFIFVINYIEMDLLSANSLTTVLNLLGTSRIYIKKKIGPKSTSQHWETFANIGWWFEVFLFKWIYWPWLVRSLSTNSRPLRDICNQFNMGN